MARLRERGAALAQALHCAAQAGSSPYTHMPRALFGWEPEAYLALPLEVTAQTYAGADAGATAQHLAVSGPAAAAAAAESLPQFLCRAQHSQTTQALLTPEQTSALAATRLLGAIAAPALPQRSDAPLPRFATAAWRQQLRSVLPLTSALQLPRTQALAWRDSAAALPLARLLGAGNDAAALPSGSDGDVNVDVDGDDDAMEGSSQQDVPRGGRCTGSPQAARAGVSGAPGPVVLQALAPQSGERSGRMAAEAGAGMSRQALLAWLEVQEARGAICLCGTCPHARCLPADYLGAPSCFASAFTGILYFGMAVMLLRACTWFTKAPERLLRTRVCRRRSQADKGGVF